VCVCVCVCVCVECDECISTVVLWSVPVVRVGGMLAFATTKARAEQLMRLTLHIQSAQARLSKAVSRQFAGVCMCAVVLAGSVAWRHAHGTRLHGA